MIMLTKLDNQKILVNLETIKYLEAVPDTLIFFTNGESLIVKESLEAFAESVHKYQVSLLQGSQPNSPPSL